jgi:hypothetical protein
VALDRTGRLPALHQGAAPCGCEICWAWRPQDPNFPTISNVRIFDGQTPEENNGSKHYGLAPTILLNEHEINEKNNEINVFPLFSADARGC